MNNPVFTKVFNCDDGRSNINIVFLMQLAPEWAGLNTIRLT